MTHDELTKKIEDFASELRAEGVRFFIFTDIDNNCNIKVDCTNEQFTGMLAGLSSRIRNPLASFLGVQFIAHGLALLNIHDKQALYNIKRNIANI